MFRQKILGQAVRCRNGAFRRTFSSTLAASKQKRPSSINETTLAGAQHKPSLAGPSLGHLISELSATRPGMEALRMPGQTMLEEHRTQARRVAQLLMGLPVLIGTVWVGANWFGAATEDSAISSPSGGWVTLLP